MPFCLLHSLVGLRYCLAASVERKGTRSGFDSSPLPLLTPPAARYSTQRCICINKKGSHRKHAAVVHPGTAAAPGPGPQRQQSHGAWARGRAEAAELVRQQPFLLLPCPFCLVCVLQAPRRPLHSPLGVTTAGATGPPPAGATKCSGQKSNQAAFGVLAFTSTLHQAKLAYKRGNLVQCP